MLQRQKVGSAPMPPIEAICEVLIMKADVTDIINDQCLIIVDDTTHHFTGKSISYIEFSQGMNKNKTLLADIYEPVYIKRTT